MSTGRQEQDLRALLLDQLPHPAAPVYGEVVHDHYLAGPQCRAQELSEVEPQGRAVSEDPSMLGDGPIPPSSEIEEISVTFLPQLRGAEPPALRPLGALP